MNLQGIRLEFTAVMHEILYDVYFCTTFRNGCSCQYRKNDHTCSENNSRLQLMHFYLQLPSLREYYGMRKNAVNEVKVT